MNHATERLPGQISTFGLRLLSSPESNQHVAYLDHVLDPAVWVLLNDGFNPDQRLHLSHQKHNMIWFTPQNNICLHQTALGEDTLACRAWMNETEQHMTQSPPSGRRMSLPPKPTADVWCRCQVITNVTGCLLVLVLYWVTRSATEWKVLLSSKGVFYWHNMQSRQVLRCFPTAA